MNATITTALIGVMVFFIFTLVCWIILTSSHRGNLVLVRFFDDTAPARELMRQAGNPSSITEEEEPALRHLLIKVTSKSRWSRYVLIGIAVLEVLVAVRIGLTSGFDPVRFKATILVATGIKFGLTMAIMGGHFWVRRRVFSALRYKQESG